MSQMTQDAVTVIMTHEELMRREGQRVARAAAASTPQARRSAALAARAGRVPRSARPLPAARDVVMSPVSASPRRTGLNLALAVIGFSGAMALVLGVLVSA